MKRWTHGQMEGMSPICPPQKIYWGGGIKYKNVDPKQGYNHAKFETSCFNGVQKKANVNVFFKSGNNTCQLPPFNTYDHHKKVIYT